MGSRKASKIHDAKIISTIILKENAFKVINGKKNEPEIRKGMNGMAKRPANITLRRYKDLFMKNILP
jgi:hypothetical protein